MIQKISSWFHKEFNAIHEAALLLSIFTLMSQLLGLIRDRLLAGTLGAGQELDIYYIAFRVPDLLFVLVGSFASFTILIPFFISKESESKDAARKFLSSVFTVFSACLVLLATIIFLLMPKIAPLIAPGFSEVGVGEVVRLSRIMLLSPLFLGISNLFGTVTQAAKRFFVYALAPLLYNIGIILGVLVFWRLFGMDGLAWGVALGAFLHLSIQVPVLISLRYVPKITTSIAWQDILNVIRISVPRTLTLALSSITLLVLEAFATTIVAGSVAIFDLSKNLYNAPVALIGISFSVAAFPTLVKLYSARNYEQFMEHIRGPLRQIIFWSFPLMTLFIILRAHIVRIILGTGRFDWVDTRLTAAALALFVISIIAQSVVLLLLRGYYASGNTKKPLLIVGIGTAATIGIAYGLLHTMGDMSWLHHTLETILRIPDVPGTPVILLPLAYTIGSIITCVLLWTSFMREFKVNPFTFVGRTLRETLLASVVLGFITYGGLTLFAPVFDLASFFGVLGHAVAAGVLGILGYSIVLILIENREILTLVRVLKHKFWKANIIVPRSDVDAS